jgi:hypothetical protein
MKKLLVAALMVLLASPAFAAIQNVKVSGDITSTFLDRSNFDFGLTQGSDYYNGTGTTKYYLGGGPANNGELPPTTPTSDSFTPIGLKKQDVFITQTRIRVDADLSDNVSTTVGLINERAWNSENSSDSGSTGYANDTNVQLYLASVTLREFLYSPLTLQIGKQVFNYGNGLILGDGGPNNSATGNLAHIAGDLTEATSYDGITATLDYKPLTISLIYFKDSQTLLDGNPNSGSSSSNVFGYNANYQLSDPWSSVFETYMFSMITGNHDFGATPVFGALSPSQSTGSEVAYDKGSALFVPGLHASTNPIKGLNVSGEVAWQLGNEPTGVFNGTTLSGQQSERREAMAAQFMATYALPVLDKYKPSVNASFTYVSGDKNTAENYNTDSIKSAKIDSAWYEFNKNQDSGTIYNTLFPLTNMYITSVGASVNPLEDVTAAVTWSDLEAASRYSEQNPLYLLQPDASGAYGGYLLLPSTNHKQLGNETDINLTYNYTEDVTFGVSLGWFVPGDVFTSNNNNTASQAMANVAVKF